MTDAKTSPRAGFYPIIPAGGSGKRLWPLSRANYPKFMRALGAPGSSLLRATLTRLRPLAPEENTYVVTSGVLAPLISRELPELPAGNILVEPAPRESGPAIALAAAVIATIDPEAVMGSFAADHVVRHPERFCAAVETAIKGAEDGNLMTVGITPTRPETGYGYIRRGSAIGDTGMFRVEEFVEKPKYELAKEYVDSGEYLWNASFFVWRVQVFLEELQKREPEFHDNLQIIAAAWWSDEREEVLARVWPNLPKIAIEYLLMEPAARDGMVATVPGDFGWSDVGDYHALGEIQGGDENGNVIIEVDAAREADRYRSASDVRMSDSKNLVVVSDGSRLVTAIGVEDLVIVDTSDVLLVCDRSRAQDVKKMVDELEKAGAAEYI
ncbi:mannose-1-phosphate guanylyltransferase [Kribbella sancticallisti]|uniref:Mannose-1-phosphate guanylyltransferase n=1 Tax=Kribbella sancticallisti TaxID=460087 RepID=A0ABP4N5R6_9ACTN